jgi:hypothetical protein
MSIEITGTLNFTTAKHATLKTELGEFLLPADAFINHAPGDYPGCFWLKRIYLKATQRDDCAVVML